MLEVNPTAGFRGQFKASGVALPRTSLSSPSSGPAGVSIRRRRGLSDRLDDSIPRVRRRSHSRKRKRTSSSATSRRSSSPGPAAQADLAKSDTGATRTSIDAKLAAEIGTGPILDIVKIESGSLKSGRSRPVVDLVVGVGGTQHTVTASVEDRGHMDYPLLLGRDILKHYRST